MLKITGDIVNIGKDVGQIGSPYIISINERDAEIVDAGGFDAKSVNCVLLLTKEEIDRITFALQTEPQEGYEVPESAKKIKAVHNYLQRSIAPQGIFGQNSDQIALALTKIWSEMESKSKGV